MPIATDPHWPAGLLRLFNAKRQYAADSRLENRYYGPYNMLFGYCFEHNDYRYCVAPQSPPDPDGRETADFLVFLIIYDDESQPVCIVEVKDDHHIKHASKRAAADQQMRSRYDFLLEQCPLPRLWGISLLGTSMRIYCGDTQTGVISPAPQQRDHPAAVFPTDFLDDWKVNILSPEGFAKIKAIIKDINEHAPI